MKRIYTAMLGLSMVAMAQAQGWPSAYQGVMLQGFSWDAYNDSQWEQLEKQADELSAYFDLIWVPQSGKCQADNQVMGYLPYYYFNQNSSFGTEAQLRSMISTFKQKGLGTIADVVVNHHDTYGWFSFPAETYGGQTYQFVSTDIVADDDNGATKTQAAIDGVSLSSNNDEGEGWAGARDLDHKSANVQRIVKAYTKYLVDDLGYAGVRYDMVKGFDGSHVADYNDNAGVNYSVGEYWDGNAPTVKAWIDKTSKKSAAFDFPFRYTVRDAINNSDWRKLANVSLISDANYRRYAVTFVENHDTQYRSATEQNDPLRKDTLAANAFLLAMPGTPCVFLPHYKAYKQEIKSMIDVRKAVGINNESEYKGYATSSAKYFANTVTGTNGSLGVMVGEQTSKIYGNYIKVLSGYHYSYWMSKSLNTAWIDRASGHYDAPFKATVSAVTTDDAKLVYTTDGTTPTANSKQVESGSTIEIAANCTLTVGLLVNGSVSGIVSRAYNFDKEAFDAYDIKVYVNADAAGWNTASGLNYHSWGGEGQTGTTWPGTKVTAKEQVNGKQWFVNTYTITSDDDFVSFVFSVGTGSPQTVDVTNIRQTSFFEITASKSTSGNNLVNDVTTATGIETIDGQQTTTDHNWYTIDGMRLAEKPVQKGLYIHAGKKVVVQ